MSDSFDYLQDTADTEVLKNLAKMGDHLKKLRVEMMVKATEYDDAKKEYEYYASSVLPMAMFNAGVTKIELMSGGMLSYERKFYCQPNKNAADRQTMAEWLRAHDGGHLLKVKAEVDGAKIESLKDNGIPYREVDDINTNSLKAFLKDKIGASGGTVQLNIQDIPACIHFYEVGEASISL